MSASILTTKLYMPAPRPKVVPRPRLIERLNAGLDGKLTLISAAAGFGKTTRASAWVAGCGLPAAWLSLDPADDEPERFFTYFIAALQPVAPGVGQEIAGLLAAGQLPPGDIRSVALVTDLLTREKRCLLVLDDLQVIQDRFILQVLRTLVSNLPPALHLVLLTREDPDLPLARLRASNQMTEIRAGDLRFTTDHRGLHLDAADCRPGPGAAASGAPGGGVLRPSARLRRDPLPPAPDPGRPGGRCQA